MGLVGCGLYIYRSAGIHIRSYMDPGVFILFLIGFSVQFPSRFWDLQVPRGVFESGPAAYQSC